LNLKLAVLGADREEAIDRMRRALANSLFPEARTNLDFHRWNHDPSEVSQATSTPIFITTTLPSEKTARRRAVRNSPRFFSPQSRRKKNTNHGNDAGVQPASPPSTSACGCSAGFDMCGG